MGSFQKEATVVDWDDKERGNRVGDGSPNQGLKFGCTVCKHYVRRSWSELAPLSIARLFARDLARRLRCTRCGKREGYVMTWAWGPGD